MALFRKKTNEQPSTQASEESVHEHQREPPQSTPTDGDAESPAPLVTSTNGTSSSKRRSSSFLGKFKPSGERKPSFSDSGPYIFAFDTRLGKTVLQKNPHWPYEDSWKRENDTTKSCIASRGYN